MTSSEKIWRALSSVGKPQGYKLLKAFLDEVEDGTVPRTDTVSKLAAAFEQILLRGAEPMSALQLKRGRGEKAHRTSKQVAERYGKLWNYIASRLDEADPAESRAVPHGVLEKAITAACEHFKKGTEPLDRRTVQRAWARHAPFYKFYRESCWAAAQVRAYLTPAEFAKIEDGPIDIALLIAAARKRRKPLGSTFDEEVNAALVRLERSERSAAT